MLPKQQKPKPFSPRSPRSPHSPQHSTKSNNSKRMFETIYGSKLIKNTKYLIPIPTSNVSPNRTTYPHLTEYNSKYNTNKIATTRASSDYYSFQRSISENNKQNLQNWRKNYQINQISKPNMIRQSQENTNSAQGQVNRMIQGKNKLSICLPVKNVAKNDNLYQQNKVNKNTTMRITMNQTTTTFNKMMNQVRKDSNPQNYSIKIKMHSTSYNFRPSTNSITRKCNNMNEAEKYDNYLNKYEIVRELGKGTYGVVHLARKKSGKQVNISNSSCISQIIPLEREYSGNSDISSGERICDLMNNQVVESAENIQESKQLDKQEQSLSQSKDVDSSLENTPIKVQIAQTLPNTSIILSPKKQEEQTTNDSEQTFYAIKVYEKFKMNKDPAKFKNIRKEINIMQNIEHPHIIKLYQTVDTLTKISLVVEYGGKQSLLDYLKQNYPLAESEQRRIANQLLSALVYLHDKNIVHRDIKLQNILMLGNKVKLIDFGFSTLTHKNRKLNSICGTPNYMAPEVLAKKQYIGEFADIWSYGVVMYTIAEGRHPFNANNYNQLQKIVNKGAYQFRKITNPIHQAFIRKILKVRPQDRPRASDLVTHPWLNIKDAEINIDEVD